MLLLAVLPLIAWTPYAGTQAHVDPGFVLTTDAAPGRFSSGEVRSSRKVGLPYELDVTWRRLGPEAGRSMHVQIGGGVVLIKDHKLALYTYDEATFATRGWTALPGYRSHDRHTVTVAQDHHAVTISVDGAVAATFPLEHAADEAVLGVGFKGATGFRSRIYVEDVTVREPQ